MQHGGRPARTSATYASSGNPTDLVLFARMRRAGVGQRHAEFVMQQFCEPDARETDTQWWAMFQAEKRRLGTGIVDVLLGPRGRGKTAMASMLVGCACWRDQEPLYVTAMELTRDIQAGFDDGTNHRRKYERAGLLVIDEMHQADGRSKGSKTDWADRTLEALIDLRYRRCLDTVLISNEPPEAFAVSSGESITSRIKECGRIVVVAGEDFRTRSAK